MLRPTVAVLVMACMLASCMTWKTQPTSPEQVLRDKRPKHIRVVLADGSSLELMHPVVSGDTLYGSSELVWNGWATGVRSHAIPLEQVRELAVRQLDGFRSGAAVALTLGATSLMIAAAIAAAPDSEPTPPPQERRPPPTYTGPTTYSSCPWVYSWDGNEWRMDSETFSGALTAGATRTDVDNLVYATAQSGRLRLKLANRMDETEYVDALTVWAVDHEPGTTVAPDAYGRLRTVTDLHSPVRAADFHGGSVMQRIASPDGWNWESLPSGRDTSRIEDVRDGLLLEFVRPAGATEATLVVDATNTPWAGYLMAEFIRAHGSATQAWYDSLDSDRAMALRLGTTLIREAYLGASVLVGGRWMKQGFYREAGPEVSKRHALQLDLTGAAGDTVRVRLESAASFWLIDYVGIDYSPQQSFSAHELRATVVKNSSGDSVRSLIAAVDREYLVMDNGDTYELEFQVPEVPAGLSRSYLVKTNGWYRVHTPMEGAPQIALLQQVTSEPHGMSKVAVARLNQALARLSVDSQSQ